MEVKICIKCNIEKNINCFHKSSINKDKRTGSCNICISIRRKAYIEKNKDRIKSVWDAEYERNKDKYCLRTKEWRKNNKDKWRESCLKRYEKNKELYAEKSKKYRISNRKRLSEYSKNKRHTDPLFKLGTLLRCRIKYFFYKNKVSINTSSSILIGCDVTFARLYLERQWKKGMTWDNHGNNGWHIDHIIPLASAKTEEELLKLCHYTNLQPLWAKENISKGKKIYQVQTKLII